MALPQPTVGLPIYIDEALVAAQLQLLDPSGLATEYEELDHNETVMGGSTGGDVKGRVGARTLGISASVDASLGGTSTTEGTTRLATTTRYSLAGPTLLSRVYTLLGEAGAVRDGLPTDLAELAPGEWVVFYGEQVNTADRLLGHMVALMTALEDSREEWVAALNRFGAFVRELEPSQLDEGFAQLGQVEADLAEAGGMGADEADEPPLTFAKVMALAVVQWYGRLPSGDDGSFTLRAITDALRGAIEAEAVSDLVLIPTRDQAATISTQARAAPRVVLTADRTQFRDVQHGMIRSARVGVLGKVTNVLLTGEGISLGRRTVLEALPREAREEMFHELAKLSGDDAPGMTVAPPVAQILPVAIWV